MFDGLTGPSWNWDTGQAPGCGFMDYGCTPEGPANTARGLSFMARRSNYLIPDVSGSKTS